MSLLENVRQRAQNIVQIRVRSIADIVNELRLTGMNIRSQFAIASGGGLLSRLRGGGGMLPAASSAPPVPAVVEKPIARPSIKRSIAL